MMSKRVVGSMVAALVVVGSACGSSSSSPSGSGGTHGTGGMPGSGGETVQPGTGGASGTGGRTASGSGGAGAGGQPGSGGAGAGGTTTGAGGLASGGGGASGGAAGNNGTGGSSASGGNTSQLGSGGRSALGGTTGQPGTGGNAGRDGGASTGGAGGGTAVDDGGSSGAVPSAGCGKTSALKNNGYNTLGSRQYYLRLPASYDNTHPHRLILGLHGATGKGTDVAPGFWGLYALSNGSTIFIAPDASGGLWSAASDTTFVDDILKQVEADLCIDTSRVMLEGFSQGAAMSWTLACSRPNVFRAVVGHSGGGVTNPKTCEPVAYFGSGGLQENVTQTTQSDQFAKWNGCTVETFAKPPTGGHACYDYKGCSSGHPVRWCPYDGPHTPSPNDSGKSTSWMPSEVWPFFSQF
jgi:poly(3-hydroxybutyrate) depolymerase